MSARKLKILCLHGYHGSGEVLRAQMAPLAGVFDSLAELVFVDAPSLTENDFGWWHAVKDERASAVEDPGVDGPGRHYKGWERTRDAIVALFESQGPFDGVFAFSQGAALTGLLVGLREQQLRFDFAMMVSGFSSNDPDLARFYQRTKAYDLPTIHIVGRSDRIVPIEISRMLAERFVSPVIAEHPGGHVIPDDADVRDRVRAFLEERRASS